MKRTLAITALLLSAVAGCASAPRPQVMNQADAVADGPKAQEAKDLAPQAFAHAEGLRKEAAAAFDDGDRAGAQILSEHAIAAYSHAFILARLARADKRLAESQAQLAKAKQELAGVDEKQRKVSEEADALDLRIKVVRDAVPLIPNAPANAEREAARREAAVALTAQAHLLCVSAWMLAPKHPGLDKQLEALTGLEEELAKKPKATPIDRAISARSACLGTLTSIRRSRAAKTRARADQDRLLTALSKRGGLNPFRDDRGVVVPLRGYLRAGKLTSEAKQALEGLGKVAKAHADFPLLVVAHSANERDAKQALAAAEEASTLLTAQGASKVEVRGAGARQPVVPTKSRGASDRNQRLEIVFVAPGS